VQPQPRPVVAPAPQQRDFSSGRQHVSRSVGVQHADSKVVPAPLRIDAAGERAAIAAALRGLEVPVAARAPRPCGESTGMDGP